MFAGEGTRPKRQSLLLADGGSLSGSHPEVCDEWSPSLSSSPAFFPRAAGLPPDEVSFALHLYGILLSPKHPNEKVGENCLAALGRVKEIGRLTA